MRILHIEDDAATAEAVMLILRGDKMHVQTTNTGEDGISLGKLYDFDCIVLETSLPDMTGFEVIKALRIAKVDKPILVLSGIIGVQMTARALNLGADDYMSKPFHKDELVARIRSLVRRSAGVVHPVVEVGSLSVDLHHKTCAVEGNTVHLTAREYAVLELLALRKGMTLTKESFLTYLYDGRDEPEIKIIDVFICKLRKKLADASSCRANFIETIWGRGYTLVADGRMPLSRAKGASSVAQAVL